MSELIPILALAAFVTIFGLILVGVAYLFSHKSNKTPIKQSSYECGLEVQETGHSKIPIKFYLTAILFILFDIEIIFLYPWAISYLDFIEEGHGLYILGGMGIFLLIFIYGLFWEIKSKALEWD